MGTTYSKEYYRKNKDKYYAANKKFLSNRPDYWKSYYQENKERMKATTKRRSDFRIRYIQRVKSMYGCSRCGYNEHPSALDFHNPGRDDHTRVSSLLSASMSRIKDEIRKCVVLCANCHRIEHHG